MEHEIFEKAPVPKAYFTMSLPVVFGMIVSLIYNMTDTYFIAKTGNTDLVAGVALCAPVFTLMIALGDIFGLGGSSVVSRLFGQRKEADGKRISVFCFYAAILCGVLTAVLLLGFQKPVLNILGADADTGFYAGQYYKFIALGAPFTILLYTPSNLLRTEGFAQNSFIGTLIGVVVNIVLDPIFILGLNMGAAGAAIATVIGNICTDMYFIWFLLKKSRNLSVDIRLLRITKSELAGIFAIGLPASVTNFMQSFGVILTNRFLLPYGNESVAVMGIVMKINMIAILVLVGFAFGAQPLIGYNYGAGNRKRLREILRFSYLFESALGLGLSVILALFAHPLVRIFLKDPALVQTGTQMLRLQLAGMVFVAIVLVSTCTFQAAGKAGSAFLLSVSRQGVLFAVVIWIGSSLAGYFGVLAAQAISDCLTAVIAAVLLKRIFLPLIKE